MDNLSEARKAIVPSVHLNGTSRDELAKQYRDMHEAISNAIKAFCLASPHGRDYYIQGDGALQSAQAKHQRRCEMLAQLLAEIESDYIAFDRVNPEADENLYDVI